MTSLKVPTLPRNRTPSRVSVVSLSGSPSPSPLIGSRRTLGAVRPSDDIYVDLAERVHSNVANSWGDTEVSLFVAISIPSPHSVH